VEITSQLPDWIKFDQVKRKFDLIKPKEESNLYLQLVLTDSYDDKSDPYTLHIIVKVKTEEEIEAEEELIEAVENNDLLSEETKMKIIQEIENEEEALEQ
jgi:hypothetical protein